MNSAEIAALRNSHAPQPTKGRVPRGLYISFDRGEFRMWDSPQTVGYLCSTPKISIVADLLQMEAEHPGSVRTLITGEPSPWDDAPSLIHINPLCIDLDAIIKKEQRND